MHFIRLGPQQASTPQKVSEFLEFSFKVLLNSIFLFIIKITNTLYFTDLCSGIAQSGPNPLLGPQSAILAPPLFLVAGYRER